MEKDIITRLLRAHTAADNHLSALLSFVHPDLAEVNARVRTYVFLRFMLEEQEYPNATFDQLAKLSIAQAAHVAPELVMELDKSRDCVGSTSLMSKKVLLLRGIEKTLHITLPAMRSAEIVTLEDLGMLIWEQLCAD